MLLVSADVIRYIYFHPVFKRLYFPLLLFVPLFTSAQTITNKLDNYLLKPRKNISFNGTVLVAHHGNIIFYKGYGYKNPVTKTYNDTATIYRIGSTTKPFTSTVILKLSEEKKLRLQDPVAKYLPLYPEGDRITIAHLLTHSSGVKEYLETDTIQKLPDSALPINIESLIHTFSNFPLSIQPGQKFSYSNSNYILLAAIIEKITGKKYEHVVREMIFDPLGMHSSGFDFKNLSDTNRSSGYTINAKSIRIVEDFDSTYAPGCGAMYSTVMDLYHWYRGLVSGAIISDSTRNDAFTAKRSDYGYGWFDEKKQGRRCISHAGGVPGFVANLQFYPSDDLCIILLANNSERDIFIDSDRIAAMILR
jgi:CubicO group peptidase (beta-lactamase class C family)